MQSLRRIDRSPIPSLCTDCVRSQPGVYRVARLYRVLDRSLSHIDGIAHISSMLGNIRISHLGICDHITGPLRLRVRVRCIYGGLHGNVDRLRGRSQETESESCDCGHYGGVHGGQGHRLRDERLRV